MNLPRPLLCLVTDSTVLGGHSLVEAVERAVNGGVNLVQLRNKDLPPSDLLVLARDLRDVTQGRALFFVNGHLDVAAASGADGVHLPDSGLSVEEARRATEGRLLIGKSVHSLQASLEAVRQHVDLLQLGMIFPSRTHPGVKASGINLISAVVPHVAAPVIGIGGITVDNAREVIEAGAAGVAVVREILASENPQAVSSALKDAIKSAWLGCNI